MIPINEEQRRLIESCVTDGRLTVFASSSVKISSAKCSSIKVKDCSIASHACIVTPPVFDVPIISFYFLPGFSHNALFHQEIALCKIGTLC